MHKCFLNTKKLLLSVVFFNFVVDDNQFGACQLKHPYRVLVCMIMFLTDNTLDSRINYNHGARSARSHLAV